MTATKYAHQAVQDPQPAIPDMIVSRHPATVEYLRSRFGEIPHVEQATAEDVRGKIVAGNLPLKLASVAAAIVAVEFAGDPPRGREYTIADMEAAGVRLSVYGVRCAEDGDLRSLPCITYHEAQQGGYV